MKGVVYITQLCSSPQLYTLFAYIPLAAAAVLPGVSTIDDTKTHIRTASSQHTNMTAHRKTHVLKIKL